MNSKRKTWLRLKFEKEITALLIIDPLVFVINSLISEVLTQDFMSEEGKYGIASKMLHKRITVFRTMSDVMKARIIAEILSKTAGSG